MKIKNLIVLSLFMSISISSIGYAQEIQPKQTHSVEVFDLGDSLTAELENPETGETQELVLTDCKKTVETLATDNLNDVTYCKDTIEGIADIPIDSSESNNNNTMLRGGSSDYDYDDTRSVKATLTVEYTKKRTPEGDTAYVLTNASGKWTVLDNNMTVYDKNFDVICKGYCSGDDQFDDDIRVRDSKYSFDYDTGYTEAVPENDNYALVGAAMECHIKRTSDSWCFRFPNLIVNNGLHYIGF